MSPPRHFLLLLPGHSLLLLLLLLLLRLRTITSILLCLDLAQVLRIELRHLAVLPVRVVDSRGLALISG